MKIQTASIQNDCDFDGWVLNCIKIKLSCKATLCKIDMVLDLILIFFSIS